MQTLTQYLQLTYNPIHYRSMMQQNSYSFEWFASLASTRELHPVIVQILDNGDYAAADLPALIAEFPHQSREDIAQIAYAQNEDKAKRAVFTRGKMGKYITRHFPTMPNDSIRAIVSHWNLRARISIVETMPEILHAIQNGPSSCMAKSDFDVHPYTCYAPRFGWKMAIRRDDTGAITGRALLNDKLFVRAYVSAADGSYCADTELQDYLKTEGYVHASAWAEGTKLARTMTPRGLVAPYIDGSRDHLDDCGEYLRITSCGNYCGDNQNGYASGGDDDSDDDESFYCEDCGDRGHYDNSYSVGMHNDYIVCSDCCDRNYVNVEIARRDRNAGRIYTESFYIPTGDAVEVSGSYYHPDHLPENIVMCEDGEYRDIDNCVYIESRNGWYECDEDNIVQLADGNFEFRDDAWKCAYSEEWYAESEDYVLAPNGAKVHADNHRDYCVGILGQSELEFDSAESAESLD